MSYHPGGQGSLNPNSYGNATMYNPAAYHVGMSMNPPGGMPADNQALQQPIPGMMHGAELPSMQDSNAEYHHQNSVLAEPAGVSSIAFDQGEELIWVGNHAVSCTFFQQVKLISKYIPSLYY